jgi:hypothetical protein
MQDVEDEPLFAERVAGIDIAKAGIEVAVRVPSDTTAGRRQQVRLMARGVRNTPWTGALRCPQPRPTRRPRRGSAHRLTSGSLTQRL